MNKHSDKYGIGYYVDSWFWVTCSNIAGFLLVLMSKLMRLFNYCTIVNDGQLYRHVENKGRAVITVSNHTSLFDCILIAAMVRFRYFLEPIRLLPWTPSAKDVCHRTENASLCIRLCKSLPMSRGAGPFQPVMDFMVDRLNCNEWIHIFPEGKINKHKERLPYKTGIGRLITEPENQPIVIPFYILGSDDVLPMKKPYHLRFGKPITILVGEPVQFSDEVTAAIESRPADKDTWSMIAEELHTCIDALQVKAEKIHAE